MFHIQCTYPRIILLGICLAISSVAIQAQRVLFDTLVVPFNPDSLIEINTITLTSITDSRDEHPAFVRYVEKKKYLLLPTDMEVHTMHPLSEELGRNFLSSDNGTPAYQLDIRKFHIIERKGKIGNTTFLVADIDLLQSRGDSMYKEGTFYYDYPYINSVKKESLEQATTNLMGRWYRDFKLHLLTLNTQTEQGMPGLDQNFIRDPSVRSVYLNARSGFFAGIDWWGFQGELHFSRPETSVSSRYTNGIIRYQNNIEYESFAIGRTAEHLWWRLNDRWIFDTDLNILIGFCKWKDVEESEPKIQQLIDLSASSVQTLEYNPKNTRGLIIRAGLIENLSYVLERNPKFQIGLFMGLGVKL